MLFRVDIAERAQLDIDNLARYCRSFTPAFWENKKHAWLVYSRCGLLHLPTRGISSL
jgi:hypothetical protein